jgi:hypothetical protein
MTSATKIQYLQRAGFGYIIAGLGYLVFGFPFWFLNAVDTPPKGHKILAFIFLVDKSFPYDFDFWVAFISISSLLVAHISLWKSREPIGETKKQNWFYLPIIGAICYLLGNWMIFPFTPLGAFLIAVGMIIVGIMSIRAKIWNGWQRFMPLIAGCYPFFFMYPLLIITGARPPAMIGLWGIPWIILGIAAWLRSKEI